jgi:hypothetical protein
MADILLTTLNARYFHAAFGLRYLFANLGALRSRPGLSNLRSTKGRDIAEALALTGTRKSWAWASYLERRSALEVVATLSGSAGGGGGAGGRGQLRAGVATDAALADYIITGEADLVFARLCAAILAGNRPPAA